MEKENKHLYRITLTSELGYFGIKTHEQLDIKAKNKKEVEKQIKKMGQNPKYWEITKIY
jgi:hypothetical protein